MDSDGYPYLPECSLLFFENFTDPAAAKRWTKSKEPNITGRWKIDQTQPLQTRKNEKCIVTQTRTAKHAVSHKFRTPIFTPGETIVIQYEARAQFLFTCNTGYITLYGDPEFDPAKLNNQTMKILEFGPEHCNNFNRTRLNIYINGVEHSIINPSIIPVDELSHLYTLVIRPNNTFSTYIDGRPMREGVLDLDFSPPLYEGPTIEDPSVSKPSDWDDRILIPNPKLKKPSSWDENAPQNIPDPKKLNPPAGWLLDEPKFLMQTEKDKPKNWDEKTMGKWEPQEIVPNPKCEKAPGCGPYFPPRIRNPKYKGKWYAPLVNNPNYKGEWHAPRIPNPNYKLLDESKPNNQYQLPPITAIGFNIYGNYASFAFTNILIGNNEEAILEWDKEDFQGRQRKQIRIMKSNYQWITKEEPRDYPRGGIIGLFEYFGRVFHRLWKRIPNKPVTISLTVSVLLIFIPIIFLCYECMKPDPFMESLKKEMDDAVRENEIKFENELKEKFD